MRPAAFALTSEKIFFGSTRHDHPSRFKSGTVVVKAIDDGSQSYRKMLLTIQF
jgi:hypothetical protein